MKEKDLKDKFKIFVNGYVGSSMLTNTEYPEAIELNANKCVQIAKDYAEQEAIEFASFLRRHCQADNNFLYWWYAGEKYNEKQLYQLFKNRENER